VSTAALSFLACIGVFAAIGVASLRRRQPTTEDYLLAGRNVSGWLIALSSAATNNSGFMFVGLLGFTYRFGVQAVWLQSGWIAGDLLAWLWVHRAVRDRSGRLHVTSLPQLLAMDDAGNTQRPVAVVAGLVTFLFLAGYAAAQLKAGSAALVGIFGWHEAVGVVLGGVIVVLYCFSGGLRASIWTDAAQAIVMLVSLSLLLVCAALRVGGPRTLFAALAQADPMLVQWFPSDLRFGFAGYLAGFLFGGLGVVGQPHILVRTMAIRSTAAIAGARSVYFLWYLPFSAGVVATGLYGRVLLPELLAGMAPADVAIAAERALPALAVQVLPEVLLGTLLAGVFAATMSTADSQILACSAAFTQDVAPRYRASYVAGKAATLAVAALALSIALLANEDVFGLVLSAWSALGATLGPSLLVRLARLPLPVSRALSMMACGFCVQLFWTRCGLSRDVFELLPGMLTPLALYALLELRARRAAHG
jgi:sodium/proline symporter